MILVMASLIYTSIPAFYFEPFSIISLWQQEQTRERERYSAEFAPRIDELCMAFVWLWRVRDGESTALIRKSDTVAKLIGHM